jgi:hypothetical protein
MATSFSDGRSRSTRREPPTMGKQLVNFITYGCESSAPFFVIYKARDEEISLLYWLICAYTFFLRNLLKRSFTWTVYCYLQTRCPLWYMVRLSSPTCDLGTCWAVLWVWTLGNFTCSQQIFNLLTACYAKWHVGQQQRYATSACPWPSSVDFPMSGLIRSFLLQQYAVMLSWASLCAVFPLVSRKGLS